MGKYNIFVLCNACRGLHPMEIFVMVENGPANKQSIADHYRGKELPSELAKIKDMRVYCPKLGRHYSQKNDKEIFLIPADSYQVMPVVPVKTTPTTPEELTDEGERTALLLDKLGERLSFERQGVRLYEAFLQKIEKGAGTASMGAFVADLRQIFRDEKSHLELLQSAIKELGGDITAETPSAEVAGILSHGILQIVTDPRTTIAQTLQAILTAELMDNDGWQILLELAAEAGQTRLKEEFEKVRAGEQRHLDTIRGWFSSMTMQTRRRRGLPRSLDPQVKPRKMETT